ncbi:MAG: hypothetical protein WAQ53_02395 [Thiofilum sp.]|uniref:hypothetical protein n=1 Tax=Thiofilum sp. TaxID=2212733 RepID=UPI0025ED7E45|nr:hypothetical protein [Thiofilum sp.]MBK8454536.1 hypothetical protein [Thiofilum sp.]
MEIQKNLFPKEHDMFLNDKKALSIIKKVESYSEIWWEMQDVLTLAESLHEIFQEKEIYKALKEKHKDIIIDEEIMMAINLLAKDYSDNRNEFQKQRDDFQEFISNIGILPALYFLSPKLAMSLEYSLSGAIVTYAKSFNSSIGRVKLTDSVKTIFKDNIELIGFHNNLIDLRNKHYAHTELRANKFFLKYWAHKNSNKINIEENLSHSQARFCETFDYNSFISCINIIMAYLKNQISSMTQTLDNHLSYEQKELLVKISSDEAFEKSGIKHNIMSSREK